MVHGRRKVRERKMAGLEGGVGDNRVVEEEEEGDSGYDDAAVATLLE